MGSVGHLLRRNAVFLLILAAQWPIGILLHARMNQYYLQILVNIGINIILAVSLNLINGITGSSRWACRIHGCWRVCECRLHHDRLAGCSAPLALCGALLVGGAAAAVTGCSSAFRPCVCARLSCHCHAGSARSSA